MRGKPALKRTPFVGAAAAPRNNPDVLWLQERKTAESDRSLQVQQRDSGVKEFVPFSISITGLRKFSSLPRERSGKRDRKEQANGTQPFLSPDLSSIG
jgi:hypothetical protein